MLSGWLWQQALPRGLALREFLKSVANAQDAALADEVAKGQPLFDHNCAACHKSDLSGGTGPKLADNPKVGENGLVVHQILLGSGFMPAFGRLSNRNIAAIATYVRNTHGNSYGIVTPDDVAAAR